MYHNHTNLSFDVPLQCEPGQTIFLPFYYVSFPVGRGGARLSFLEKTWASGDKIHCILSAAFVPTITNQQSRIFPVFYINPSYEILSLKMN